MKKKILSIPLRRLSKDWFILMKKISGLLHLTCGGETRKTSRCGENTHKVWNQLLNQCTLLWPLSLLFGVCLFRQGKIMPNFPHCTLLIVNALINWKHSLLFLCSSSVFILWITRIYRKLKTNVLLSSLDTKKSTLAPMQRADMAPCQHSTPSHFFIHFHQLFESSHIFM